MEMGYSACSSTEKCRQNVLSMINGCDPSIALSPETIAKAISMMIRTYTGLDSQSFFWPEKNEDNDIDKLSLNSGNPNTWNIEVFVQTIKELVRIYIFNTN